MTVRILHGDVRQVLPTLPDASVHCVVTSPPYWAQRSYLPSGHADKHLEIGSEPTLQDWVSTLVDVFRQVRRVLRDDGTVFLNLGDSYATGAGKVGECPVGGSDGARARACAPHTPLNRMPMFGLKPKDLIGQPWALAFALRAGFSRCTACDREQRGDLWPIHNGHRVCIYCLTSPAPGRRERSKVVQSEKGWYLRQDIIFHKRNPMPESVTDRCTKAHEYVFLLSKSERYYWNFDAMQEPASGGAHARRAKTPDGWDTRTGEGGHGSFHANGREKGTIKALPEGVGRRQGPPGNPAERKLAKPGSGTKNNDSFDEAMAVMPPTRNPRSVWTMNTVAFKGAHFATFPPKLAERCITAGCPPGGGVVLDPFGGSGTVGMVADRMHLDAILIDLDARSVAMASERIVVDAKMFAQVSA